MLKKIKKYSLLSFCSLIRARIKDFILQQSKQVQEIGGEAQKKLYPAQFTNTKQTNWGHGGVPSCSASDINN